MIPETLSALAELLAGRDDPIALTDPDEAAPLPERAPVSRVGDIWELGESRLLVGDATDEAAVLDALGDDRADCVWTDPPYGVDYVGKTKKALVIQNDTREDLPDLLSGAFRTAVAASRHGAPVYVAYAMREHQIFKDALESAGIIIRQHLVWVKNTMVLSHADYQYRHEPIIYGFTPGGTGRLGRGGPRWCGDNRATTVFEVDKPPANRDHPTMKPVELIDAMLANSLPTGGLVLDLFGGSGSTLIAAHHRRSRAVLVELDPRTRTRSAEGGRSTRGSCPFDEYQARLLTSQEVSMTSRAEQVRVLRLAGLSFADIAARLGLDSPDAAASTYESVSTGATVPFLDARPHTVGGGASRPHSRGPVAQGLKGRPIDRILRLSERRLLLQERIDALEEPPSSAVVRTGRWDDAEAKGDQGPAGPGG